MRNKLIDELEKMIELLHQTGWHKQAVWYENKLKLIKEGEEDCVYFIRFHILAFYGRLLPPRNFLIRQVPL